MMDPEDRADLLISDYDNFTEVAHLLEDGGQTMADVVEMVMWAVEKRHTPDDLNDQLHAMLIQALVNAAEEGRDG